MILVDRDSALITSSVCRPNLQIKDATKILECTMPVAYDATVTVGLEPVDSGGTTSAVAIEAFDSSIAAVNRSKRGLYVTNEIHSDASNPLL